MERGKASPLEGVNMVFELALEGWKNFPESQRAKDWINDILEHIDDERMGLEIRIFASALEKSEGSRAILPVDLKKWTKRHGPFVIFEFNVQKDPQAKAKVKAVKDADGNSVLVILNNQYGVFGRQATFFPEEIASFIVK